MMFSRTAVHGIYALCYLNQQNDSIPVPSLSVAGALGIPQDQASKVLQSLNNAGLVDSTRGRSGGYVIARELKQIYLTEVLDALNPPDNEEHLRPQSCSHCQNPKKMCDAHMGLQNLNDKIRKVLSQETLGSFSGSVCTDLVCVT